MSLYNEVIIQMTEEQREEIKQRLGREVTQVKFWLVVGAVVLAEVMNQPEAFGDADRRDY